MTNFLYFAYGSNMLTERLKERCSTAEPRGVAVANGYEINFSKQSCDKSGKATLQASELTTLGVVFELHTSQQKTLGVFEGDQYRSDDNFPVQLLNDQRTVSTSTYIAKADYIDVNLKPYDWYMALIIAGATQHQLGVEHINWLKSVEHLPDPKPDRRTRSEARTAIFAAGYERFWPAE